MAEAQFTSVITDEAMQKVNYTQGWLLKPYQFAVLDVDILGDVPEEEIFDPDGVMYPKYRDKLKNYTTEDFNAIDTAHKWCQMEFSSLTRQGDNAITHHVIIPGSWPIDETSKEVKTIVFLYLPVSGGQPFVYAVARSNNYIVYEPGVTQSYFFNFTLTNAQAQDSTEFIINYSYPQEIADHNAPNMNENYEGVHDFLIDRAGTRKATGPLVYDNSVMDCSNPNFPQLGLVTKKYVKQLFDELFEQVQEEICPIGTMMWYPGTPKQFMASRLHTSGKWTVRDGRWLSRTTYAKLDALLAGRYGRNDTGFGIMNDFGLFIRGCEWTYNPNAQWGDGSGVANTGYLSGIEFAQIQGSAAPNIWGTYCAHQMTDDRSAPIIDGAFGAPRGVGEVEDGKWSGGWYMTFNAHKCWKGYTDGIKEARPRNRNYTPIIKIL